MPNPDFKKGMTKKGGRKKGVKNKSTIKIKTAIMRAFHKAGGEKYLLDLAKDDPKTFCTLLAKLIPAELNVTGEIYHATELSDTERSTRIAALLDLAAERRDKQTSH